MFWDGKKVERKKGKKKVQIFSLYKSFSLGGRNM